MTVQHHAARLLVVHDPAAAAIRIEPVFDDLVIFERANHVDEYRHRAERSSRSLRSAVVARPA